jgi:beta-galactosidase
MEQSPTYLNWRQRNSTKRPGVMRLGSFQAVARGADGVMFFQWRASKAGAEKFHSAMLPHAGTESREWRETQAFGQELSTLAAIRDTRVHADTAILFDWNNWWALELDSKPSTAIRLMEQVTLYYTALFKRNITVDLVHPAADLSGYRLVIAPTLYLVDDQSAANIDQYVANGGTLVMSFFSGIVDENDHIRLGGYPAPFANLLGLRLEEISPFVQAETNRVTANDNCSFSCEMWADVIRLEGAEALAVFEQDYYSGAPAVTRHIYGKGVSYYVGTMPDSAGTDWVLRHACATAAVSPVLEGLPEHVECVRREGDGQSWLFLLNYGEQTAVVTLNGTARDCISGQQVNGMITLEPRGVAVLQEA